MIKIKESKIPEYDYECRNCENSFSIVEKMTDSPQTYCEECETQELRRVILSSPHLSIPVDTVGRLADKNWKKMGPYEREEKLKKDKVPEMQAKKERNAHMNKLAKMTPDQKAKWIREGD